MILILNIEPKSKEIESEEAKFEKFRLEKERLKQLELEQSQSEDFDLGKIKKVRSVVTYLSLVTQIGLTMVACILIGFFGGMYLDRWLNTGFLFLILLTFIGVASGFRAVYLLIMRLSDEPKK